MKVTVVNAKGQNGCPEGNGIVEERSSATIEVPEGSTITDIWKQAKESVGGEPGVEPIIYRHEVSVEGGETRVAKSSHVLTENQILYLVM